MPPVSMLIKPVSGLCNMKCEYCFYTDVANNRKIKSYGLMREETLEKIVEQAFFYGDGYCSFAFQGGEPTLAGLDFYKKLVMFQKKYNKKNIEVFNSIQTNGYNISTEFAKFLKANNFLVGISIDGTKEIHDKYRKDFKGMGTFHKVYRTTKMFDKLGVSYNILCVVNNYIARDGIKVYNALKRFKYLQFIPLIDDFDGKKNEFSLDPKNYQQFLIDTFKLYYNDFMKNKIVSVRNFDNYIGILLGRPPESCAMCGVCSCYFLIEADGTVFPCDFYVLDQWKIGNIYEESFSQMINSKTAQKFVEISKVQNDKCKDCKWFNLCGGGCKRDREPICDDKPGLNIYCESYISFFENCYNKMIEMRNKLLS